MKVPSATSVSMANGIGDLWQRYCIVHYKEAVQLDRGPLACCLNYVNLFTLWQ